MDHRYMPSDPKDVSWTRKPTQKEKLIKKLTDTYFGQETMIDELYETIQQSREGRNLKNKTIDLNENKKKKPKADVKAAFKRFINNFSVHGLRRIPATNLLLSKIVWGVLILVSSGFGIYIVNDSIRDYFKYDVISLSTRIDEDIMTMPSLTICKTLDNPNYDIIDNLVFCAVGANCSKPYSDHYESLKIRTAQFELDCVRWNSWKNESQALKKSYGSGYINGLRNDVLIPENITLISFVTENALYSYENLNFVPVIFGSAYYWQLIKAVDEKLEEPYNECEDIADKLYRKENCIEKCKSDGVITKFNCTIRSYYMDERYEPCVFETTPYLINAIDWCEPQCPRECYKTYFTQIISTATLIVDPNYDMLGIAQFSVFFQGNTHLKLTQIPKTTGFTLFSNIGGALSLFIGLKVLNFVDIFELIVNSCYTEQKNKK